MSLAELRPRSGEASPVRLHRQLTVIDPKERDAAEVAAAIRAAIVGESRDLEAYTDAGDRVERAAVDVLSLSLAQLPAPSAEGAPAVAAAAAEVAAAEAVVADARAALDAAERTVDETRAGLIAARREVDDDAEVGLEAAEARLEVANAGAAAARRALEDEREARARAAEEARRRRAAAAERLAALRDERARLEDGRVELERTVATLTDADPEPVRRALEALTRLRQVKPRPSPRARQLADQLVAVRARLVSLPSPPEAPAPKARAALAALTAARRRLAGAEADTSAPIDPVAAEAVERAHREVVEAEQRAGRKATKTNRRRLDEALDSERAALAALGLDSYGEFVTRVANPAGGGGPAEARAALARAEAAWQELHGGEATPEWTAAKEQEAAIHAEAVELLGREVPDDELEDALRSHLESVVETGWAEQELADALRAAGGAVVGDVQSAAEAWLRDLPLVAERRRAAEDELAAAQARLDAIAQEAAALEEAVATADDPEAGDDPLAALQLALDQAEAVEADAALAVAEARAALERSVAAAARVRELEAASASAGEAVTGARRALADAERTLEAARAASHDAARAAESAAAGMSLAVEAEAVVLARLAGALRRGGSVPVVVDAGRAPPLSRAAARRLLRLVERASSCTQIVVVGGADITRWGRSLKGAARVATM